MSSRIATLHELDTVYGICDLYLLLEVVLIDRHNEWVAEQWAKRQQGNV